MAILSEEVIAENKEYLQLIVTLGGSKTTEVYRWTPNEITLVYQDHYQEGDEKGILENFSGTDFVERYVGEDANWEVIGEDVSVEIDGKDMKVLQVYQESDEVVGHTTKKTRYFAKDNGLVFERIEVVGDQGYISEITIDLQ
ncbi:hypothetical protein [Bacillus coahuilensis]|nr:hypothetical protein [Bacillus coahuilensis]